MPRLSVGLAKGRRKKTQVENLRLLASPVGHDLRALALTCDDLRSLWSRSNLHPSQRKFFTVWPPYASQRKSCCLPQVLWLMAYLDKLRALASRLSSPFGHPTQVCTQVRVAVYFKYYITASAVAFKWLILTNCVHLPEDLRIRLATQHKSVRKFNLRPLALPFGQGFKFILLSFAKFSQ